jgi:multidrug efflux pump subunit AcrA (membrane-fusion protein)
VVIIASATARAQSVREHTRPKPDRSTAITESQATELTLTVSEASIRPIQVWVRTAGRIDGAGRTVTTTVSQAEGRLVRVGQRVRAFPPESRSSMYQAWITEVLPQDDHVIVKATLSGPARQDSSRYVLEIVTENVQSLSVPNEAIIETGGKHVVYVQQPGSRYVPREIRPGVQGELYTQVLDGLQAGERVVTFGSFFIDADHKLKGS